MNVCKTCIYEDVDFKAHPCIYCLRNPHTHLKDYYDEEIYSKDIEKLCNL